MTRSFLLFTAGVAVAVMLKGMIGQVINPLLAPLKLSFPAA